MHKLGGTTNIYSIKCNQLYYLITITMSILNKMLEITHEYEVLCSISDLSNLWMTYLALGLSCSLWFKCINHVSRYTSS